MEGAEPFIPFVELLEQTVERLPPADLQAALGDAAPEVARLLPDLRRLFPDMPQPLEMPPAQQRRFLFKSVVDFFERAGHARSLVNTARRPAMGRRVDVAVEPLAKLLS